MPKPDPSRDLYADLEIAPTATSDEIKKQFHRLALKYHPDRNPGKETEYATKFQIIQSANEILSDPEQRKKYDVGRPLRASGASTRTPQAPTARSSRYEAHSDFPPPPRRTGPPRTAPASGPQDAGAPPPPPQRPAQPPPPPNRNGADRYSYFGGGADARPPKPTTAAQDAKNRQDKWRAWDSMAGSRAEYPRPAGNKYNVPPAWQGPHLYTSRSPNRTDARSGDESPRTRSAYETVRDPLRPQNPRTTSSRRGFRGFDPNSPEDERPISESVNGYNTYEARPQPPSRAPTGHASDHEVPVDLGGARKRMPYSTTSGERTVFNADTVEGLRRAASVRDATKLHSSHSRRGSFDTTERRPRSSSPPGSYRDGLRDSSEARAFRRHNRPYSTAFIPDSDSGSEPGDFRHPPRRSTHRTTSNSPPSPESSSSTDPDASPGSRRHTRAHHTRNEPPPSVTKTNSYFVNHDSHEVPTAAKDYAHRSMLDNANLSRRENLASSSDPNMRRATAFKTGAQRLSPGHDAHAQHPDARGDLPRRSSHGAAIPAAQEEGAANDLRNGAFPAAQWEQSFQNDNWTSNMVDMEAGGISPTRNGPGRRGRPSARPGTKPSGSSGRMNRGEAAAASAAFADLNLGGNAGSSPAPDAMEIDPKESSSKQPSPTHHVVDPSRPEWSDNPKVDVRVKGATKADGLPNLNTLRQVPPLATAMGGGVDNLADLKATLPFDSQPSTEHPSRVTSSQDTQAPVKIQCPQPPAVPQLQFPVTTEGWNYYLMKMAEYMSNFNLMNAKYVAHFQDRAVMMAEMCSSSSHKMIDGWLGVVGETDELGGWPTYRRLLAEEDVWRKSWEVACERHRHVMELHDKVREKVLAGHTS